MFNTHYYRGHNSRDESGLSFSGKSSGEIGAHRESSASDCKSEVELESGAPETKVHSGNKRERDCRICHLGLESCGGLAIELGCSCKGDLGAAHKKCAETWFKIKGDMICEICGATAVNVAGDQVNEAHISITVAPPGTNTCGSCNRCRKPSFLAWPPHNELLACLHGLCIYHFLVFFTSKS